MHHGKRIFLSTLIAVFTLLCTDAIANTPQPQFHMGRLWMSPEYDGAGGWDGSAFQYPGGIARYYFPSNDNRLKRGWIGQGKKWGSYLFTKNWTDPEEVSWDDAASYFFRTMNYNYPRQYVTGVSTGELTNSGKFNYLYAVSVQEKLRWERPVVSVLPAYESRITVQFFPGEADLDSVLTTLPDNAGIGPRPLPVIDPGLVTEEVIDMVWRYIQGVEYKRSMYGYPYGSPHQDYILQDITLTNNGISGNMDEAPVLTDQSITNMVWVQAFDRRDLMAPIEQQGMDVHGKYIEPWGAGGHAAILFWDGDDPTAGSGPDYGDPIDYPYPLLAAHGVTLIGPIFASVGPGGDYAADDLDQPVFNMVYFERGIDIAGKTYSPPKNDTPPGGATDQRELLTLGTFQVPIGVDYHENSATQAVGAEDQGPTALVGYGKKGTTSIDGTATGPDDHGWDLAFGESVRIVQMVAGGGIDDGEAHRIASTWMDRKSSGEAADTWMSAEDQALVQTGVDTAMKAAALAAWNFSGALPAGIDKVALNLTDIVDPKPDGHGEFDVPEAPRPPGGIYVSAVGKLGIEVRWTKEAELVSDFDTDVNDFAGYRVWRQAEHRSAPWELVADSTASGFADIAAEGDLPAGRCYMDTENTHGMKYWYAVTAYDDGSQNWGSASGKSLESSRWWTWTGYSEQGVTAQDWDAILTTTWTKANSPYRISEQVTVAEGHTLTIQAGVDVLFDADVEFVVRGSIRALGTETDSVRFLKGTAERWGGIEIVDNSSSLKYTRISGASGLFSGGLHCYSSGGMTYGITHLFMDNCTISGNTAETGGGLALTQGVVSTLTNCTISGNTAEDGGGLYIAHGTTGLATLINCTIDGNTATGCGGGVHVFHYSTTTLTNCTINGNTAGCGGGISNSMYSRDDPTHLSLDNCTISGNTAVYSGGLYINSGPTVLVECIVSDNTAEIVGGLASVENSNAILTSCIISGNTATDAEYGYAGGVETAGGGRTTLANCVVTGNITAQGGGLTYWGGAMTVTNSIVWANDPDQIYNPLVNTTATVTYSDIQGGYVGEGNIDADPMFTDAVAGNYRLQPGSPCIGTASNGGNMGLSFAELHPTQVTVRDVPKDQGGKVLIRWRASSLDTNRNVLPSYTVWRLVPEGIKKVAGKTYRIARTTGTIRYWEPIASPPAHSFPYYAYTAPTFYDSMSTGPAIHEFMVSAQTSNLAVYHDSEIAVGYSVDNLAPPAPVMKAAYYEAGKVALTWNRSVAPDLSHYLVYRGEEVMFDPVGDPIGTPIDTVFVDENPVVEAISYYLVFAVDVHGNIGPASNRKGADLTAVALDILPKDFSLSQNMPNPFNPTTTIRYALPQAEHVLLTVYDVNGRMIRQLINRSMHAGYHRVKWNGRDGRGRAVGSGVYLYRLVAGDRMFVKRMVTVR